MMHGIFFLFTIIGGAFLAFLLIIAAVIMIIRMLREGFTPGTGRMEAREARMIQEIYQGLGRMEERVETLETILMEKPQNESSHRFYRTGTRW